MRSLWLKLMGAFALVILVGGVTDSLLMNRATSTQFSRFITENGQRWAQQLAPGLTAYYARNGSWQDVESILANPWMSAENNMQPAQERPRWTENSGMMGGMTTSVLFALIVTFGYCCWIFSIVEQRRTSI